MKKFSVLPKKSRFSSRRKGWVSMGVGVVLLQFRQGAVNHGRHSGSMYWQGRNEAPEGPASVQVRTPVFR